MTDSLKHLTTLTITGNKSKNDDEEGNYYLGKIGNKTPSNDDDVDY